MNNLDRGKIRMAQLKWFMGGKAHGEPFPHSPPDSLHLWGPKLPRQHHHDVTLEEGHPHFKATTTAAPATAAAGPSREAGA